MSKLLLTPALTGGLLYALTAAPDRFREPLLNTLKEYVSATNIGRAITALKWLLALGVYRDVTSWLSELAQNEFRLRSEKSRYHWPSEVAVITGGTGGMGSLMSKDFASRGVTVIVLDIVDELPAGMQNNPKIKYFKCDITDRSAVNEVAEQVRKQYGNPSILINNAGVAMGGQTILTISEKQVSQLFGVNICSHFNTVQAFLPAMIKNKKGHVVTIASLASFVSTPGLVAYSNSKSAALSFHEGLQQELRTFYNAPEIKCTVVHPTFVDTPMTAEFKDSLEQTNAQLITPETVANAVVAQVLSGRGRQIILNGNVPYIVNTIRSWPHWLSVPALMSSNRAMRNGALGKQNTGQQSRCDYHHDRLRNTELKCLSDIP